MLQTLEGYGTGLKMWDILAEFWLRQEVVARQNGYHGPHFRAARDNTQGGMVLPPLFNVAVESLVCHWLSITVEDAVVIHDGLGHAVGSDIEGFLCGRWSPCAVRSGVASRGPKSPY